MTFSSSTFSSSPRSPKTNVTVAEVNNNSPTVTVVNTQSVTVTNVNNDEDTNVVTAINSNSIRNTNTINGRAFAWPDGWVIPYTAGCTQTYSLTSRAGSRRRKYAMDNL